MEAGHGFPCHHSGRVKEKYSRFKGQQTNKQTKNPHTPAAPVLRLIKNSPWINSFNIHKMWMNFPNSAAMEVKKPFFNNGYMIKHNDTYQPFFRVKNVGFWLLVGRSYCDVTHWFVNSHFEASSSTFWVLPCWFFLSQKWPCLGKRLDCGGAKGWIWVRRRDHYQQTACHSKRPALRYVQL